MNALRRKLETHAEALGFDAIGVADARTPWLNDVRLAEFLDQGRHGDMDWLAQDARAHPNALWSAAKSAIIVGQSYAPADDSLALLNETGSRGIENCHGSVVRHPIAVQSLAPDIEAPWTIEAYRAGRDPAMEAIAAAMR